MKDNREILVDSCRIQERMNNLEAINKIDAIAKAFDQENPKCFYCKCDIDKTKDFPFIHKDTFNNEWRCVKCSDKLHFKNSMDK
jgi:predicted SprT family Zn-dependent metalloprotease